MQREFESRVGTLLDSEKPLYTKELLIETMQTFTSFYN